jgi:hypothetical protein
MLSALHQKAHDRQSMRGRRLHSLRSTVNLAHHCKSHLVQQVNLRLLFQTHQPRVLPLLSTAQYFATLGGGHHYCIMILNRSELQSGWKPSLQTAPTGLDRANKQAMEA